MSEVVSIPNEHYLVFHDFTGLPEGTEVAAWPQHMTILPRFVAPPQVPLFMEDLVGSFAHITPPIDLHFGNTALFGPNENIPVTLVPDERKDVYTLHAAMASALGGIGCKFLDETYMHGGFRPHVTHKDGVDPPVGRHTMTHLSLGRRIDRDNGTERTIHRRFEMGVSARIRSPRSRY